MPQEEYTRGRRRGEYLAEKEPSGGLVYQVLSSRCCGAKMSGNASYSVLISPPPWSLCARHADLRDRTRENPKKGGIIADAAAAGRRRFAAVLLERGKYFPSSRRPTPTAENATFRAAGAALNFRNRVFSRRPTPYSQMFSRESLSHVQCTMRGGVKIIHRHNGFPRPPSSAQTRDAYLDSSLPTFTPGLLFTLSSLPFMRPDL